VLVYAGAIMVLFLFVIMLLNLGREKESDMVGWAGRIAVGALSVMMLVNLWALRSALPDEAMRLPIGAMARMSAEKGAIRLVADPLFREYLIPFEITSILLLAGVVGAVVLAKRKV
jgi:NADH-quinone oxidoreductase subunit J